jgi:hypothetical protein
MIAVITAVLTGSATRLHAAVASGRSLAAAAPTGVITVAALMRYQQRTWPREGTAHLHAFDEASRGHVR